MRSTAAALLVAFALAGCTVIPPADPARMPAGPSQTLPESGPAPGPAYPPMAQSPSPYPSPPQYPPQYPAQPPAPPELPALGDQPLAYATLGQTVSVGGPRITPLTVLEDSRCAMNARCVWAGQVRLRVRIDSGRGGEVEMTSGKPVTVADGMLELVEIRPDKVAGGAGHGAIAPSAYRFGFRFSGGY